MVGWHANKEFVSARAECQLVKDGVRSWEAVRLPIDEIAFSHPRSSYAPRAATAVETDMCAGGRQERRGAFLPRKWPTWLRCAPLCVELHGPALPLPFPRRLCVPARREALPLRAEMAWKPWTDADCRWVQIDLRRCSASSRRFETVQRLLCACGGACAYGRARAFVYANTGREGSGDGESARTREGTLDKGID